MSIDVVIVDDDARFRRLATALLTRSGCTVVAAAPDGASGIEAARRLAPDGMLLDVNLPDRDGLAVARELRGADQPISIVLTSTELIPWSERELADAGVRAFVAKEALPDADLPSLFSS
ncbi:response regulator transcription factor [Streptomyces sp. NPDC013178]|uniref:response regulator n=1 Tax=Streptomyces sp. NPDC013178 TaxID=3155118 RepID=UPI0033FFAC36